MKVLNDRDLPVALLNAVKPRPEPPDPKRLSVTDLINPPLQRYLKNKYYHEIEEDIDDHAARLLGTGFALLMEQNAPEGSLKEEKFEVYVDGVTVVGKIDLFFEGVLIDYKTTSVWHFIDDPQEWVAQLNVYKWLMEQHGHKVERLVAVPLLKDRSKNKARFNKDYPQHNIYAVEEPVWSKEQVWEYISSRVTDHTKNCTRPCTPEERWHKPSKWAVMKAGRKSALRLLPSIESAVEWARDNGCCNDLSGVAIADLESILKKGISIVERQGEDSRCLNYCPARGVCRESIYYGKELTNEDRED